MKTKTIASTTAQNNFGQILNDVVQNNTRYVINRHKSPQAIVMSLTDFERLFTNQYEQEKMVNIVREMTDVYCLGETIQDDDNEF